MITESTDIRVDSDLPKSIKNIRIAPIWANADGYNAALMNRDEVLQKLKQDVLLPYLQLGGLPSYIEKGETLLICDKEFFVNDCFPREGIMSAQSQMELEIGFTKEVFQRKQVLADQRIASRLQHETHAHSSARPGRSEREAAMMQIFMRMSS